MFGIEFIEVGIGLVFAFFAISTICSGVVEIWVRITKLRSRHLRQSLGMMLDDPGFKNLVKKLYEHPSLLGPVKEKLGGNAYINAEDFSEALIDILGGAGDASLQKALVDQAQQIKDETLRQEVIGILEATPGQIKKYNIEQFFADPAQNFGLAQYFASFKAGSIGFSGLKARISSIDAAAIREHLNSLLNSSPQQLEQQKSEVEGWFSNSSFMEATFDLMAFCNPDYQRFKQIEKEIESIDDKYLRQKLSKILYSCADGMGKLESRVEIWFNETMEDVSRWYRKRVSWVLTGVAVVVVCSLNADAVRLASDLWNDNQLRAATVELADDYVVRQDSINKMKQQRIVAQLEQKQAEEEALRSRSIAGNALANDSVDTDSARGFGVGTETPEAVITPRPYLNDSLNVEDFKIQFTQLKEDIEEAEQMPIGWNSEPLPWNDHFPEDRSVFWWVLSKILGLAITIGATSFGATFWYDILRNLLTFRLGMRHAAAAVAPKSKDED